MWSFVLIAVTIVLLCFAVVVFFGAPYVPTLTPQVQAALTLLNLKPGQTMLELGCGDGKVLLAAAKQGYNVVGYELNPILAIIAWARTYRYREQVRVVWGNFWHKTWPDAQGIFAFVMPNYMAKLDKKITQEVGKPVKLVSNAFEIVGVRPDKSLDGVHLYRYK